MPDATPPPRYRPRRIVLGDGRVVTMREIAESDAGEIVQAFERLDSESRYTRFMQHKEELDMEIVERGVRPRRGQDFAFVATVPAGDGFDIVGAAQYVADGPSVCEFAITVACDWRRCGLGRELLAALIRRARRDGYESIQGLVMAQNAPMVALARELGFAAEPVPGDATVVRVRRALAPASVRRRAATRQD